MTAPKRDNPTAEVVPLSTETKAESLLGSVDYAAAGDLTAPLPVLWHADR